MEPGTVCIPGKVEPVASPSFPVPWAGKQLVQGSFIGIGSFISEELVDLFRGWWQADDIQVGAAQEGCPVGTWGQRQSLFPEFAQDEGIDGVLPGRDAPDIWGCWILNGLEGPVVTALQGRVQEQCR